MHVYSIRFIQQSKNWYRYQRGPTIGLQDVVIFGGGFWDSVIIPAGIKNCNIEIVKLKNMSGF